MWVYIILVFGWGCIIFGWVMPVVRRRIVYEIYVAFGSGSSFTLLILGSGGVLIQSNILPLRIIGLILCIPAIFLIVLAFATLKREGKPDTIWDNWQCSTVMINSNIFRIVRHPLYLGGAIWAIGLMLVFQSVPSIILGAVSVLCFWMASKKEEAFNIGRFGDGYKEYMKEVPMWNILKVLRRR